MSQNYFRWEKEIFSSTYTLFNHNNEIGKLKSDFFAQKTEGIINEAEYLFKTSGLFTQTTLITDLSTNEIVGEISYGNWMTKAKLILHGKDYAWKYDNHWNSKWSITDNENHVIKYGGDSMKGKIESEIDNDLALLSGLFVTNYYWVLTIIIISCALIPIWLS